MNVAVNQLNTSKDNYYQSPSKKGIPILLRWVVVFTFFPFFLALPLSQVLFGEVSVATAQSTSGIAIDLLPSTRNYDDTVTTNGIESERYLRTGETIELAIVVQGVRNLDSYIGKLLFDETTLQFTGGKIEDPSKGIENFLKKNGGTLVEAPIVLNKPGEIIFGGALRGQDSAIAPEGSGIVALITFRALKGGDSGLSLQGVLYTDSSLIEYQVLNIANAIIHVEGQTLTTTPYYPYVTSTPYGDISYPGATKTANPFLPDVLPITGLSIQHLFFSFLLLVSSGFFLLYKREKLDREENFLVLPSKTEKNSFELSVKNPTQFLYRLLMFFIAFSREIFSILGIHKKVKNQSVAVHIFLTLFIGIIVFLTIVRLLTYTFTTTPIIAEELATATLTATNTETDTPTATLTSTYTTTPTSSQTPEKSATESAETPGYTATMTPTSTMSLITATPTIGTEQPVLPSPSFTPTLISTTTTLTYTSTPLQLQGSIYGRLSEGGRGLHGAKVYLLNAYIRTPSQTPLASTITGTNGEYSFTALNPGHYVIRYEVTLGGITVTLYYNNETNFLDATPVQIAQDKLIREGIDTDINPNAQLTATPSSSKTPTISQSPSPSVRAETKSPSPSPSNSKEYLKADFDGDGIVYYHDLILLADHYFTRLGDSDWVTVYDLNVDNIVNGLDLSLFHSYWLKGM